MHALSLFSGAGGFELGFDRAGINTIAQVEIDPWCREVLARHWPLTQRISDVREVDAATLGRRCRDVVSVGANSDAEWLGGTARGIASSGIDLVYGGFPCQDLSVAGKRAGFSGERSSLWFEFHRVLRELRSRWTVIENVPGLLSSNGGADFSVLLRGLGDLGYGWAYRVLDGRWFGVPQRRRRVFIVGCLGDAQRAAQVLAVCESCGGHPQARPEAGEGIAPTLDDGARGVSVDLPYTLNNGQGEPNVATGVAFALQADAHNYVAATLSGGGHANGVNLPGRHHEDDDNLVIEPENFLVASAVRASDGHHGHSSPRGDGADNLLAFHMTQDPINTPECRTALGGNAYVGTASAAGVRRLTPLECERLMGWPDDWTRWTADGREIPDSHRYRLCGNGVIATVAEWIGHRLVWVDKYLALPANGEV